MMMKNVEQRWIFRFMVYVYGLYSEDVDVVYSLQQFELGVCVEGLGVCIVQCWMRFFSVECWL